jgi:alkylation response protein AidB-like acyl-CoA dehydrogenase
MTPIVDRAHALEAAIVVARAEMDRLRRLPVSLAKTFTEAEFYRLCIPRVHGGLEAEPQEIVDTIEALAEADASAAWCVMIGATTGAFGAYLDKATASAIFPDPALIFSGVYAPTGKATLEGDAYRVSGRWRWNSGGQNATWLCGGCVIYENGAPRMVSDKMPEHRMMLFPASHAAFIDTWHTSGLRGSGSGDMTVSDILVPKARTVSLISDQPVVRSPLYAFPIFGLLAIGIAAVASGNARAALREFSALASSKRTPTGRKLADQARVQAAYAEAAARLSAARAFLTSTIAEGWTQAQAAKTVSMAQRACIRLAATHMVRTAAEVVRALQDLAGGGGVFLDDPLQRRLADAQVITAHIMTAPATYELTGRALLGVPISAAEL